MATVRPMHSSFRFQAEELYGAYRDEDREFLSGGISNTEHVADWIRDNGEGTFSYSVTKSYLPFLAHDHETEEELSADAFYEAVQDHGMNGDISAGFWYDADEETLEFAAYSWGNDGWDHGHSMIDPRRLAYSLVGRNKRMRIQGTLADGLDSREDAERYLTEELGSDRINYWP